MTFHRVKEVKPPPDYMLSVQFMDGEKKKYDVKPLFSKWEASKALENVKCLFEQVQVDMGGYGIIWNDYIDLSCDELYYNGVTVGGV